jgi:[acyl-carrier-protein] S-malonyltransferase
MSLFLFPGQGSQKSGMGRDFYDQGGAAAALFHEAKALAPAGFLDSIFSGSAEDLRDTRLAQPALLTVETAIVRHLEEKGAPPAVCAGHSLGEIPALAAAGGMNFSDAFRLVRERARLMREDVPDGGMAAVMGLAPAKIEAALPEGAQVANYNGPAQTIISGNTAALAAASEKLRAAGAKRVIPLNVSGPFHSRFMQPAAEALEKTLADIELRAPAITFISSVSGQVENDPERIRTLLSRQLVSPVRWTQVMETAGVRPAAETGPGSVLRGLAKRMPGAPEIRPAGTVAEADAFAAAQTDTAS